MKIMIHPFFSQFDRQTGHHLLNACCTTQISLALARALKDEHQVTMTVPRTRDISVPTPPGVNMRPIDVPRNNLYQRLEVDMGLLEELTFDQDLIISHHELLSLPLRMVSPRIKICQINHMQALGDWEWMGHHQLASWQAADLVVLMSDLLQDLSARIYTAGTAKASEKFQVWPLIYDRDLIEQARKTLKPTEEPIELLFVQRCSSSNYTHHQEFVKAIKLMKDDWKVTFTDPTHYLETTHGFDPDFTYLHAKERGAYYHALARTTYAIALMENDLHGGIAIREAIASGALPILLDTPAYRHMLGPDIAYYPGFIPVKDLSPIHLAARLDWLLGEEFQKWLAQNPQEFEIIQSRVAAESYQAVIEARVKPWLKTLEN